MKENKLNELQGASILTKSFFNKLIRRIECTKPLAGSGISVQEEENGFKLSVGGSGSLLSEIQITVCQDGAPSTITVLGRQ
jgi:hypothetical protein